MDVRMHEGESEYMEGNISNCQQKILVEQCLC